MMRLLTFLGLSLVAVFGLGALGGCGDDFARITEQVPAVWRDVRTSAGHTAHVAKHHVACADCHGKEFGKPPQDLCEKCHGTVPTPLHNSDPLQVAATPGCRDCHGFGSDPEIKPTGCMRCHKDPQGKHVAVGTHSSEKCGECHRAHQAPSLKPQPCVSCHEDQKTAKHADKTNCLDCHSVHEGELMADTGCANCHKTQKGPTHVDTKALTTGHPRCTGCHKPHSFTKQTVADCATCHKDQQVLAADKHTKCIACHQPHNAAEPASCKTCHREVVTHPAPTKIATGGPALGANPTFAAALAEAASSPASACAGCHPPHQLPAGQKAVACENCHTKPKHGTAKCRDCHEPHAKAPVVAAGFCNKCHQAEVKSVAATGHNNCGGCHTKASHEPKTNIPACATCHADKGKLVLTNKGHDTCTNCHKGGPHSPQQPPAACATCHTAEQKTAPAGHQACANCHEPHSGQRPPAKTCASCHTQEASHGHGKVGLDCATCHRPHGPKGVATPPACATCHAPNKRPGLHASKGHLDCAACHTPHEVQPKADRASCLSCHKDKLQHEPTAPRCNGCHPFADISKQRPTLPVTPPSPPGTPPPGPASTVPPAQKSPLAPP